jgi:hypothetical protein
MTKNNQLFFCLSIVIISFIACKKDATVVADSSNLSDSNTKPWIAIGLSGKIVQNISVSKSAMYGTTLRDSLFRSTDNGVSWKALNFRCYYSLVTSQDSTVLVTHYPLFFSANFGDTWTDFSPKFYGKVRKNSVNCSAILNNVMIIGMEEDGIFISTDNGNSFIASSNGLQSPMIYNLMVQGNNVYAQTLAATVDGTLKVGGVFVSTNNGLQWSATGLCSDTTSIECMAGSDKILIAGTMNHGVFISSDKGMNWTHVTSGLTNQYIFSLAIKGDKIFAASREGEVFLSNDNGVVWSTFSSGLPKASIFSLAINADTIYAGSGNGIWKRSLQK